MNRTVRVLHRTGYRYEGNATSSYNEARMTPLTNADQQVLHSRIDVSPRAWQHSYTDYWGNTVTAFEVHDLHERLEVLSTSTVQINRQVDAGPQVAWSDLEQPSFVAEHAELLVIGRFVEPGAELDDLVVAAKAATSGPADFVPRIVGDIRNRVSYLKGVTGVHSHAREAWEAGAGVCQDLSHLTIGAFRRAGIPTRYVSGYLMSDAAATTGEGTPGESHAWVQYWAGGWQALDPTNLLPVTDQHIEVAYGRDYGDVSPLRGIFSGGATCDMFVEVLITPLR